MALSADAKKRKDTPIYSGFIKYFPDAIAAVAELSRLGNDQHNPGKELFWDRSKSGDELDAQMRHLVDHASGALFDTDQVRHLTKNAWRAMAALQKALELAAKDTPAAGPLGEQYGRSPADYPSRWLMQDPNGHEWETVNEYTYKEAVTSFGATPFLRVPAFDTATCGDGDDVPSNGHMVGCPCYTCAKARRDAAGAWE